MKLLLTIRTANRAPKRNYVGQTMRSLIAGGVNPSAIHVCPTSPDVRWIWSEFKEGQKFNLVVPRKVRTANENAVAQCDVLQQFDADWLVMSEDDLEWCADPLGSIARWLEDYAIDGVSIYRFFAFDRLGPISKHAALAPLREQRGSQVVAMRADDARRFAAWARQHPLDWRPTGAPFQNRPHDGFDKLLGYWALQDRPHVTHGLVSRPFFVRHLGTESSLHSHGVRRDDQFGGVNWSYRAEVPA